MPRPDSVRRRRLDRLRGRPLTALLRKAWSDHVLRYSTSVIVECRTDRDGRGSGSVHAEGLSFMMARAAGDLPPLGNWLAPRRDDFTLMLKAGKIGFFALDRGVAVSCMWLAVEDHHDLQSREFYRVHPREAYHYCWLTDPDSRSRNVTMPLCRHVFAQLAGLGIDHAFGVVDRVNRASYLLQLRLGYRERGLKVIHIVLLRQRFTFMRRYDGVLGTTNPRDRKMPRA